LAPRAQPGAYTPAELQRREDARGRLTLAGSGACRRGGNESSLVLELSEKLEARSRAPPHAPRNPPGGPSGLGPREGARAPAPTRGGAAPQALQAEAERLRLKSRVLQAADLTRLARLGHPGDRPRRAASPKASAHARCVSD
jgi:hypothetical protein